ncbi:MAG: hypothetical protein LWW86_08330 [Micrococcales bacterium]|nr:hypothetical protein [Micrococcales bacterium]
MYAALWRVLPGPAFVKFLELLVLVAAAVMACFLWLFPAVAPHMPFNDSTVGDQAPTTSVTTAR